MFDSRKLKDNLFKIILRFSNFVSTILEVKLLQLKLKMCAISQMISGCFFEKDVVEFLNRLFEEGVEKCILCSDEAVHSDDLTKKGPGARKVRGATI